MFRRTEKTTKPKRSISIKWKIATITAFSSAIALMLAFEFLIVYDLTVFQKSLDHDLTALAQVIGSNSSGALASHDAPTANKALAALRARKEIMAAGLYDAKGHILGRYLRQGVEGARLPASPKPNGTQMGKGHLEVFQSVREGRKVRGYIYLASDTSAWSDRLKRYTWIVGVALLGSMVFAFLVAWILQRTISSPIVSLAHTMRRVSTQKNYSLRAEKPSDDEIGALVDGFNSMLAEIQERDAALQRANEGLEMRVSERTAELELEIQERTRAEEEISARNQELLTLHRISQIDVSREDLSAALQEIVEEIATETAFPMVSVELYDKRRQVMTFQAATGFGTCQVSKEVSADESLSGAVARSGSPLVQIEDGQGSGNQILLGEGVKTFICMPMAGSQGVIGTLSLAHVQIAEPDSRLLRWLESLANYLGLVVERQRSAQMLREGEERTRKIIETALDAVITVDSSDAITGWNGQAEAIFGWPREEVLGKQLDDVIIPQKYKLSHVAGFNRFLSTGETRIVGKRIELSALHRDGTEFPVEVAISPVKAADTFTFTAFIRDITDRKRSEQELAKARDAAVEAARLKSEFLANMSHEIRTPMNGVIGMTDLILDGELSEEQRDYAQTIRNSADALLKVINEILDFSKIEAGKMSIDIIETSLTNLLEEVSELLTPVARAKGIELICDIDSNVPPLVKADPVRIRQVINNLVGNAVKFTESGQVVLSCQVTSQTKSSLWLKIAVKDTGIGIPAAGLDPIFESFTQVDGSTTRRFGGTGLGLTICRQLTTLMGGRIGVQSAIGKGSTFWVELPVEKARSKSATHVETQTDDDIASGQKLRILLAEDNAVNRKVASKLLSRLGHEVVYAENGAEAVKLATASDFDIILMDVQMPEVDGLEASAAIRQFELDTGKRVPIMALTAHAMKGDRERCLAAGMDDYVSKPITPEKIKMILRQWSGAAASGPKQSEPIVAIDESYLDEITGGDVDFLNELVSQFTETAPKLLEEMSTAVADSDTTRAKAAVHSLKGCSSSIGAAALAEACQAFDESLTAEDNASPKELLTEIKSLIGEAAEFLRNFKKSQAA